MNSPWILAWFNLIFTVPFMLAALYLLLYAMSGVTFGEPEGEGGAHGGADADGHAAGDGHAGGGIETDAHAEVHGETAAGGDAKGGSLDAIGHHEPAAPAAEMIHAIKPPFYLRVLRRLGMDGPFCLSVLRYFGVGRVPLSILLMAVFFVWGFLGTALNLLLRDHPRLGADPWQLSIPLALLGTAAATRGLGRVLGQWLPTMESYVHPREALVGRAGEAVLPVDERFGLAVVRNARGTSLQVPCRVAPGAPALARGTRVRLVRYDPSIPAYFVTAARDPA